MFPEVVFHWFWFLMREPCVPCGSFHLADSLNWRQLSYLHKITAVKQRLDRFGTVPVVLVTKWCPRGKWRSPHWSIPQSSLWLLWPDQTRSGQSHGTTWTHIETAHPLQSQDFQYTVHFETEILYGGCGRQSIRSRILDEQRFHFYISFFHQSPEKSLIASSINFVSP